MSTERTGRSGVVETRTTDAAGVAVVMRPSRLPASDQNLAVDVVRPIGVEIRLAWRDKPRPRPVRDRSTSLFLSFSETNLDIDTEEHVAVDICLGTDQPGFRTGELRKDGRSAP